MKRSELDPRFQWNLKDIFPDVESWEKAMKEAEALVAGLEPIAGTLGKDTQSLKNGLDQIYRASEKIERAAVYASLYAAGDMGNPQAQEMDQRASLLYVRFSTSIAFVEPEILTIDEKTLKEWMDLPEMSGYRHILEDIDRSRSHTLSQAEEKLLAMMGDAASTPHNAFDMFESVDMRFPDLKDGRKLTHALFGNYREDPDPEVRKEAFAKYFGEFGKYIHTLTALYSGSIKQDCFYAKARQYPGAMESALFANKVPRALYENLIECAHKFIPVLNRYLEFRKEKLGLKKLSLSDLYVPLIEEEAMNMPFEDARELVLKATRPLGDQYQSPLHEAFDNQWIDVYENEGKTTGAFSCGVYGVHPYVLLNYTEKFDDAFTLAHELGHSMHSWFSSHTQDYANNEYRIFVAEVASTVNEVLLTRYLLSVEKEPRKRAYILNHLLEGFRTTVFRQTLFAEFEMKAHAMYEAGTPLTAQALNQVYHDLNTLYYPLAEGTNETDMEWARIPHFYRAFYVYQYATGFCSAVAIADKILKENGAADYLRFLSTGGSMYPMDELKIAGVDLNSPEPIERALHVFEETVDEFVALMKEIGE